MSDSGSRWRALASLLRPHRRRWGLLGALVAIAAALSVSGPLVVRRIVDRAIDGTTPATIVRLAALFLAIAIAGQIVGLIVTWLATTTAWQTTNDLRLRLARHVLGLDHEFHRTHTPGELISRVDGDVTAVSDFLSMVLPKVATTVCVVTGVVASLAFVDWRLAVGAAAYLTLTIVVLVRSRHRAVAEAGDEMHATAKLYGGIEERLTAAE
ncbi:MAG TPA: ABC transporter transmembrane domain-containing protein, partial [Ilumatobacteraceae bacterium]|nr:ABC transporter transmembrane domain-containing protein [Ilumatobacteraceae bacterium]